MMRTLWTVLALLLTVLAIGGVAHALQYDDAPSITGDLIIAAALGVGAWRAWRRRRVTKRPAVQP